MNKAQIEALCREGLFMGKKERVKLVETHISWVLLTKEYAYKIKKPIRLSFLDFRKLSEREHYCREELRLNRRLAKQVYLDVQPITLHEGKILIGAQGKLLDYAVRMLRLDNDKLMSLSLDKNRVSLSFIVDLAKVVAGFHKGQKPLKKAYDPYFLSREFADILKVAKRARKQMGEVWYAEVLASIAQSNNFVEGAASYISARAKAGCIIDCHGDLHTQNIFAYDSPLVFDCVEFKKEFRQIDYLNEVAFLCMDLESRGRQDLSDLFFSAYAKAMKLSVKQSEMQALFNYFKAYRACIRAKVNVIALLQHPESRKVKQEVKRYTALMKRYLSV